jgi:hypothetical protein
MPSVLRCVGHYGLKPFVYPKLRCPRSRLQRQQHAHQFVLQEANCHLQTCAPDRLVDLTFQMVCSRARLPICRPPPNLAFVRCEPGMRVNLNFRETRKCKIIRTYMRERSILV